MLEFISLIITIEISRIIIIIEQSKQIFNQFYKGFERYCLRDQMEKKQNGTKTSALPLYSLDIPLQSWIIFKNKFSMACFLIIIEAKRIEDFCILTTYWAHF